MHILICCRSEEYRFFIEYINSLKYELHAGIVILNDMEKYHFIDDDKHFYIICQKLPDKLIVRPIKNMMLLNTEQTTRHNVKNELTNILNRNIKIIDYSIENIEVMGNHKNLYYAPYQYINMEIERLKRYIREIPKEYDFVFVGDGEKRKYIANKLQELGFKILFITSLWGGERDREIAKAKILVNIHWDSNYNVFETLRCDRWLFAGMMIISENSIRRDNDDLIVFSEYDQLIEICQDMINNYNKYSFIFNEKHQYRIDDIKNRRDVCLKDLKENVIMKLVNTKMNKVTIETNTLELFSANWTCNFMKPSFVKLNNNYIELRRGFNILFVKNKELIYDRTYDTCIEDYSFPMQKYLKQVYDEQKYDYLILITHDDAVNKTNGTILEKLLIFFDCQYIHDLRFRTSYALLYDLQKRKNIFENSEQQFPIHEWFEFKNDNTIENLGIPVYIIAYNFLYFVKNIVNQLKQYTKNIHIIDNKSTYPDLLEYYNQDYEFFLHKMETNYGHYVWKTQIYWQCPKIFAITDPDLELNLFMPKNFLTVFKDLSYQYQKGKVGCALDISDSHLFFQDKDYTQGCTIKEWEDRFWIKDIKNDNYQLYEGSLDTTLCVVNKQFEEVNNAIRVAGDYSCKHIPWYVGWHNKIDPIELEFYKKNNMSSSTLKMILRVNNDKHKHALDIYNEVDDIINKINGLSTKINNTKENRFSENECIELTIKKETAVDDLIVFKKRIADIISNNLGK